MLVVVFLLVFILVCQIFRVVGKHCQCFARFCHFLMSWRWFKGNVKNTHSYEYVLNNARLFKGLWILCCLLDVILILPVICCANFGRMVRRDWSFCTVLYFFYSFVFGDTVTRNIPRPFHHNYWHFPRHVLSTCLLMLHNASVRINGGLVGVVATD